MRYLFEPAPYKIGYGGRGSAKTWNYARYVLLQALGPQPIRILCAREFQNSIRESVHATLRGQIYMMGLESQFRITDNTLASIYGSEFIFKGLHNNVQSVRSMENIKICWVEEAANVSKLSWETLIPTIFRQQDDSAEMLISFNPMYAKDETYQRFVLNPPDGITPHLLSYRDNPWFPPGLRREMEYLKRVDYDAYLHVWEGKCRSQSDAQVFRGKYVSEAFEISPSWNGPYQGTDWGFAVDPTTLVRCYISQDGRKLFISHEAYQVGLDIDKTPEFFKKEVPLSEQFLTRADSAQPSVISYMQRHGFPEMRGVEKWAGSVEDGIRFLRQFEQIVIHPRCIHALQEAEDYSYKIDKLTNDVLPEIVDKHNHIWDAVRYALEPIIRQATSGLLTFIEDKNKEDKERAEREKVETARIVKTTQQGLSIPAWLRDMKD